MHKICIDFGYRYINNYPELSKKEMLEKSMNETVSSYLEDLLIHNSFEVIKKNTLEQLNLSLELSVEESGDPTEIIILVQHHLGCRDAFDVIYGTNPKSKELAEDAAIEFLILDHYKLDVYCHQISSGLPKRYRELLSFSEIPIIITHYTFTSINTPTNADQLNEAQAIAKAVCSYFNRVYKNKDKVS